MPDIDWRCVVLAWKPASWVVFADISAIFPEKIDIDLCLRRFSAFLGRFSQVSSGFPVNFIRMTGIVIYPLTISTETSVSSSYPQRRHPEIHGFRDFSGNFPWISSRNRPLYGVLIYRQVGQQPLTTIQPWHRLADHPRFFRNFPVFEF